MLGDCRERLKEVEGASIDAVICDPPYPEIDRPYGRLTEDEWRDLIHAVVAETRRILKPRGSAVFILQPNSRKVGSMRGWLWEFMAWCCREWNMVQDVWWWNFTAPPTVHCQEKNGLSRPSLKACVWLGDADCYRDQNEILWTESEANAAMRASGRCNNNLDYAPSGYSWREERARGRAAERGGVTPFNLLPIPVTPTAENKTRQSATTPLILMDRWTRYICPEGGAVCDPFMGSGTAGLAALKRGRSFVGIERDEGYFKIAERRIAEVQASQPLFTGTP